MDLKDLTEFIIPEYQPMYTNIIAETAEPFFITVSNIILSGISTDIIPKLNVILQRDFDTYILDTDEPLPVNEVMNSEANEAYLYLGLIDYPDSKDLLHRSKMDYGAEFVVIVLPHQRNGYKLSNRYLIDKLLTDGFLNRCSDLHIESVYCREIKSSKYLLRYRKGLYLTAPLDIDLSIDDFDNIVSDLISNRSDSTSKLKDIKTEVEVRLALTDRLYPVRISLIKSIYGTCAIIRFLPQNLDWTIEQLGFPEKTQKDLLTVINKATGLSMIGGNTGSGKGTTINALALKIEQEGRLHLFSIDSPTEFLVKGIQIEYRDDNALYKAANSTKKADPNILLINEIATRETGLAVYNLAISGVHVLTTAHYTRISRFFYKMSEMIGDLYYNLIPVLNIISYQEKFSVACEYCKTDYDINYYAKDSQEYLLLEYLGITQLKQPKGCEHCKNGVNPRGIKVVCEYVLLNKEDRKKLVRLDIHQQSDYLEELSKEYVSLENECTILLKNGEILLNEVVSKIER